MYFRLHSYSSGCHRDRTGNLLRDKQAIFHLIFAPICRAFHPACFMLYFDVPDVDADCIEANIASFSKDDISSSLTSLICLEDLRFSKRLFFKIKITISSLPKNKKTLLKFPWARFKMILNPIGSRFPLNRCGRFRRTLYRRLPALLDARRPWLHQVQLRRASQKWLQKRSSQNLQNSLTKVIYSSDPSFFRRFTQKSQKTYFVLAGTSP